jgi:hypothetical protein
MFGLNAFAECPFASLGKITAVSAVINAEATVICNGKIIGEEWINVNQEVSTWIIIDRG